MAKPLDLPFPALAGLLSPLPLRNFFDEWWEKAPGVLPVSVDARREGFLSADWLKIALASREAKASSVELIERGLPQAHPPDADIGTAVGRGATVRLLQVQRVWPFARDLVRDLEWEMGFRVGANIYVTPEGRQGLDIHADSHDVIVVQMSGGKDWEIFGSPYPLPVDYRPPLVFEEAIRRDHRGDEFGGRGYKDQEVGPPLLSVSLSPGDLLYVPRGFVHKAVASHGTSAHLTIGLHSTTWGDLLALAVAQEARTEAALRETVPPGATRVAPPREFIDAELRARGARLFERIHGEALMLETAARFSAARKQPTGGPSADADQREEAVTGASPTADEETPAPEVDPSALYSLAPEAYITFGANTIEVRSLRTPSVVHSFPAPFRKVFDALVQGQAISATTAAPLTRRSAQVFLSRLAKAGVLVRQDPPGTSNSP